MSSIRFLGVVFVFVCSGIAHGEDIYVSPVGHEYGNQSRQALQRGFKAAAEKDFDRFMATAGPRYIQHSPDLPDGWKPVWDLLARRPQGFSTKKIDWLGPAGMLDNGNYLVMFREVSRGDGTPPSKVVDIMIFNQDGKYTEHWDIRQPLLQLQLKTSGMNETDASRKFIDSPVSYSVAIEEENKKTAAAFLHRAFNDRQTDQAMKQYVVTEFVQHAPSVHAGDATVGEGLDSKTSPKRDYDIQLSLAQNDIVVVYSRCTVAEKVVAVVDIFRIREGALVEHWDVQQEVPPAEKMPHTNGMFSIPAESSH